jgi:hypothetical protein
MAPGLVSVESYTRTDGTSTHNCLEVNGCNYGVGGHVDTSFGCKPLPKPGSTDKCAANMAWKAIVGGEGALASAWDPSLCASLARSHASPDHPSFLRCRTDAARSMCGV